MRLGHLKRLLGRHPPFWRPQLLPPTATTSAVRLELTILITFESIPADSDMASPFRQYENSTCQPRLSAAAVHELLRSLQLPSTMVQHGVLDM